MAFISKERTFTWEKIKRISSLDIANIFLIITMILPFFLFQRAKPQAAFYLELTAVISIALFLLFASYSLKVFLIFNRLTLYLTAIVCYLILDIFINVPPYSSIQWLYIGSLLLSALVAVVVISLCYEQGYKKVLVVICYGLMIGAMLQDVVVILQTLHQEWTMGWIYYIEPGQAYSGNIGQRNLLAHYLSWGILASAYLAHQKKLGTVTGWSVVVIQAATLGAVNSKTLILYMLVILLLLVITRVWQRQLTKSIAKMLALTIVIVIIFQAITLPIISSLQDNLTTNISSIERFTNNPEYKSRLIEWYKAWLIFSENPWFGSGWGSYGYEGFVVSSQSQFAANPHGNSLFSHSHNIILNLLAETGIVGTLIVLVGFGYVLKPLFTTEWQIGTLFVLSMLIVTGIHSLVEFPIWYLHYFIVFVILLAVLISTLNVVSLPKYLAQSSLIKLFIIVISIAYSLFAIQLYYYYWQMEQYTYAYEKNERERIATAQNILDISQKQPLLSSYSDYLAASYLVGLSPDNLPQNFHLPLSRFAYYLPQKNLGIYYLATQCDVSGAWNDEQWQYYSQLKHYYTNVISSTSIILSMTDQCKQVFEKVHAECENYLKNSNKQPICDYR
ncbi:Wzy polymerase domain-containing protein [Psychrobacter sp. AH5]|uniref:PglL family O-oligosaccharyltransferase n=1 Tax=Psychrobacter sp. AH5 TaxID=2937433 RepID=UPI0033411507